MSLPDELRPIFDRIAQHQQTDADMEVLRQYLSTGGQLVSQQGKYAVNLGQGQNIHIGDRIYQGADAETIRDIVRATMQELQAQPDKAPDIEPPAEATKMSSGQRQRMEQRQATLQAEWDLRNQKIQRLRSALAIEAGTSAKFQLEKELADEEAQLVQLSEELDQIELRITATIPPGQASPTSGKSDRLSRLAKLYDDSRDWCIQRFLLMVSDIGEAAGLADNLSIGVPPAELNVVAAGEVILLIGELGIGKTLIAQRLFQKAIKQAQENEVAPIPVYLESREWKQANSLKQAVEDAVDDLVNPFTQGVFMILDGLDEADSRCANQVLVEACLLARKWKNTTVIITSRSTRITDEASNNQQIRPIEVQPLSDLEAYLLIERVSKQTPRESNWTASLKDAIRRPLFALILARYLRADSSHIPRSTGELLSWFVEDALKQANTDYENCDHFLKQLASLSVDRGGGWIRASDVDSSGVGLKRLLDSRLVIEPSRGWISFPLPILTEWFAARSLVDNLIKIEELVAHPQRLENWRYPLIIAIANFGEEIVFKLIKPIVQSHPTFAAEILLATSTRWRGRETSLPPFKECGKQIQTAMKAWVQGFKSLAPLIAPICEDGTIRSLGVKIDDTRLEAAWYIEVLEEVVLLPDDWNSLARRETYTWMGSSTYPGGEPAWAWCWTLNNLVNKLGKKLETPTLLIENESLIREAAWRAALAIIQHGKTASYVHQNWWGLEKISLAELESPLAFIEDQAQYCRIVLSDIGSGNGQQQTYYLSHLRREITRLKNLGVTELSYPWIGPDLLRGERLWELYSPQQLSIRVKTVYKAALDIYQEILEIWFPLLKSGLKIGATLPARLVGNISPNLSQGIAGTDTPDFYWFLEALPVDQTNEVEVNISNDYIYDSHHDRMEYSFQQLKHLRPESEMWIRYLPRNSHLSREHFFGHSPATALAYSWLRDDLRGVFGFSSFIRPTRI
jgi:Effector-associated domain 10/NACHT domain